MHCCCPWTSLKQGHQCGLRDSLTPEEPRVWLLGQPRPCPLVTFALHCPETGKGLGEETGAVLPAWRVLPEAGAAVGRLEGLCPPCPSLLPLALLSAFTHHPPCFSCFLCDEYSDAADPEGSCPSSPPAWCWCPVAAGQCQEFPRDTATWHRK